VVSIDASEASLGAWYNEPNYFDYYYFFDWEVEASCGSDRDSVFLQVNPLGGKPAVFPPGVNLYCPDSVSFYSLGDAVIWFDQQGNFISDLDTLTLDRVGDSTSLYCQTINESPALFGGLRYFPSKSGGIHDSGTPVYMEFDVREEVTLLSVVVHADSAGMRSILLNDGSGAAIDTIDLMVQAGQHRIPLDIELSPGSYQIGGTLMGLAFQDQEVKYPIDVTGLISVTGTNADPNSWYFFFDWEVKKSCASDYTEVPVHFLAVPSPMVGRDTLTIICNGQDTLDASSLDHTLWYDEQGTMVGRGDSLPISSLQDSTTFFAVNETKERFYKGGLTDSLAASGGYSFSPGGLIFDVFEDVMLRSVKVYARSAGNRSFTYRDSLGNMLDSIRVLVPQGESRVPLNFSLQRGKNFQLSVDGAANLYRETSSVNYPYIIYSYLSITQSTSSQPMAHYNYFYDWEVGDPSCQSVGTPVFVQVAPFQFMGGITGDDTLCYEQKTTFNSTPTIGSWLDSTGNLLLIGSGLTTPNLTKDISYSFIPETEEQTHQVGPVHPSLLGLIKQSQARVKVFFTVESPLRLNSVWVGTTFAGQREVILEDHLGNVLQRSQPWLPIGTGSMYLGWELEPGNYAISGDSLNLYANEQRASYPYHLTDWISITGNNIDPSHFYFFYDWEIQAIPCKDDSVIVEVTVLPEIEPLFSYSQMDNSVVFSNLSSPLNASWHWDFGDGDTSILESPTHSYSDTGYHVVTLTVNNGFCESFYSDTVYINTIIDGIQEILLSSFRLFPNPGNGRFTIEAKAESLQDMKIAIYDLQGRILYQSAPQHTAHFHEEVDLGQQPAGTFVVQFWINNRYFVRKYVKY
jgi:hypothetical protein